MAARAAQAAGASRVMILDWGIHHGHGTESIFEEDNNVLVVSMHRADECVRWVHAGAYACVLGMGYTIHLR